jgi:hypothetical protein
VSYPPPLLSPHSLKSVFHVHQDLRWILRFHMCFHRKCWIQNGDFYSNHNYIRIPNENFIILILRFPLCSMT